MSVTSHPHPPRAEPTREERIRALWTIRDYFQRKAEYRETDGKPALRERADVATLAWAIAELERPAAPPSTLERPPRCQPFGAGIAGSR